MSREKTINLQDFQELVSQSLVRHRSILDIMAKLEQYSARTNRALVKSVTSCGCLQINAKKQDFEGDSYQDFVESVDSHLEGTICPACKEAVESEIGTYLFYLASLANSIGLNLDEILDKEMEKGKTLGLYNLR